MESKISRFKRGVPRLRVNGRKKSDLHFADRFRRFAEGLCERMSSTVSSCRFKVPSNRILVAANEVVDDSSSLTAVAVCGANDLQAVGDDSTEWIRIARYGDHPHQTGMQRFHKGEAEEMVRRHKAALTRLKNNLLGGSNAIPIYRGHPDEAAFAINPDHEDNTVYGFATDLEARDDGLYIKREMTEAGNALLKSAGKLYFSPRWVMWTKASGNHPFKLLSLGMTRTPNISGSAANATTPTENKESTMLKALLTVLGYEAGNIEAAANAKADSEEYKAVMAHAKKLAEDAGTLEKTTADLTAANSKLEEQKKQITAANEDFSKERAARAALIVDTAVSNGKVTAARRDSEVGKLIDSTDFSAAANAILDREAVLPVGGQAQGLGKDKPKVSTAANARAAFEDKVEEQMGKNGGDYNAAYSKVLAANPDLYKQMNEKPEA